MPLLRKLLLGTEPAGTLSSLEELFALASAMEQEAADRYEALADEMRRQNKPDLSAVFTQLAAEERKHVDGVTKWSQARLGKDPDPAPLLWVVPEAVDAEADAAIRTSRLMTPYRALSIAVDNEERAFAFWSYLAAFAEDPRIKRAAEDMAREELGHVATLRKERRLAYHRERDQRKMPPESSGAADQVDAAALERRLSVHLTDLARSLTGASARRALELSQEANAMSTDVAGHGRFPAGLQQGDAQEVAKALAESYLEGAERVADPARLESFQKLAERAIARLAWMRSLTP
jgi:rubrerythrin